ncbi:MAG: hypothetical protein IPG76_22080 [Acidobacteria bacterium]|nr:hypothetical protein [Acidobacteriota bacterium]
MIKRYTLTMALLGLFVLIPGNQPSSARNVLPGNISYSFDSLDGKKPVEEYYKWRENYLGKHADKIPHYSLTVVTKRLSNEKALFIAAIAGKIAEGYSAEFQPVHIGKSNGRTPNYVPFGEPYTINVGFSIGDKLSKIEEIPGMRVLVPLDASVKLLQVKLRYKKDVDDVNGQSDTDKKEKDLEREMNLIVPVDFGEASAYTYGIVETADIPTKSKSSAMETLEENTFGAQTSDADDGSPILCTPPCKFASIYGGPGGCLVAKCCIDNPPALMDPYTCTILCWSECWLPPIQ